MPHSLHDLHEVRVQWQPVIHPHAPVQYQYMYMSIQHYGTVGHPKAHCTNDRSGDRFKMADPRWRNCKFTFHKAFTLSRLCRGEHLNEEKFQEATLDRKEHFGSELPHWFQVMKEKSRQAETEKRVSAWSLPKQLKTKISKKKDAIGFTDSPLT